MLIVKKKKLGEREADQISLIFSFFSRKGGGEWPIESTTGK